MRHGKSYDSKGKTLAAAARLFRQQGYHGTALHDILAAGGSPRGSLYFHFPKGKEEIGEAALTLAGEAVRQAIAHAAETSESAEVFLTRMARGMASDLEKSDFREGCPIATTALETSRSPTCWARRPAAPSELGKRNQARAGTLRHEPGERDLVATLVLSQLEGALLLARTYRSLEPMHRAEQALKLLITPSKLKFSGSTTSRPLLLLERAGLQASACSTS